MRRLALVLLLCAGWACSTAPQDPVCSSEPYSGPDAAVQVAATTDETFYVLDESGKQIAYARTNQPAKVKPGRYQLKINSTLHATTAASGKLTKCGSGTALVSGATGATWYVLDGAGTQLAYARLGEARALFPGAYQVRLNGTRGALDVRAGAKAELVSGLLEVPGTTRETWYVLNETGDQLSYATLGQALALLPGKWIVRVNGTRTPVETTAGGTARFEPGAVVLEGTTADTWYILDREGNQLAYAKLGEPRALAPGAYTLRVNGSTLGSGVEAGKTASYTSGTLTVKGKGEETYYVLDPGGTQLAYAKLNASLALAPGQYKVRVAGESRDVTITAGQPAALTW